MAEGMFINHVIVRLDLTIWALFKGLDPPIRPGDDVLCS